MKNFNRELEKIFNASSEKIFNKFSDTCENRHLISNVYGVFKEATEYFNDRCEFEIISIVKIPRNLNSLLFNFHDGRGFLITFGNSKMALVLFEKQEFVTFVGRTSSMKDRNIKLLRLSVERINNGNFYFRDNSGLEIQLHEVVLQVMKWGMS